MQRNLAISCLLLMSVVNVDAGNASAAFSVTVAVPAAGGVTCTTTSGRGAQVNCTVGVFVTVGQVNSASGGFPTVGRFIDSFGGTMRKEGLTALDGLGRDGEPFDDSVAEAERNWNFACQLYAADLNASPTQRKTVAQLRQKNCKGTLTAIYVSKGTGGAETVEMLVSF